MKSLALIVAVILAVASVPAQQPQGALTGVVRDASGMVLPGVTVEVTGPNPGAKSHVVVTDTQGRYNLSDLPPGSYAVSFRLAGFRTRTRNFACWRECRQVHSDILTGKRWRARGRLPI